MLRDTWCGVQRARESTRRNCVVWVQLECLGAIAMQPTHTPSRDNPRIRCPSLHADNTCVCHRCTCVTSPGTVTKTKDFEGRKVERDIKKKSKTRKVRVPEKKMTHAERLREAVKTEYLNAQSLLRFQQKEAKAKKTVLRKTTFKGPFHVSLL